MMRPTIKTDKYELWCGKAEDIMPLLPAGCADAVIADPPYGTTACKWDTVIPFEPMWAGIKHVAKERAAIALFGSQPFTSALVMSNPKMFKYCWVWDKKRPSNFFAVKFQPLNNTEDIIVFSEGGSNNGTNNPIPYNPQGMRVINRQVKNSNTSGGKVGDAHKTGIKRGEYFTQKGENYPKKVIQFIRDIDCLHPTQKPVDLMSYLIKTYTNGGETVLDFTMGSGSTGVAAIQNNRYFIGIEKDEKYFGIAAERLAKTVENMQREFNFTA